MATATVPPVDVEQYHASLRVSNLAAAIDLCISRLRFRRAFSWGEPPAMAGVSPGQTHVFLEAGTLAPQGCSLCFVVGNADELHDFQPRQWRQCRRAGGDRAWGLRDYSV